MPAVRTRRRIDPIARFQHPFVSINPQLHFPRHDNDEVVEIVFMPPEFGPGLVRENELLRLCVRRRRSSQRLSGAWLRLRLSLQTKVLLLLLIIGALILWR